MHDFLVLASLFTAALFLYWLSCAVGAFERLQEAERSQAVRLASYCGVNPYALPEHVLPSHDERVFHRWAPRDAA